MLDDHALAASVVGVSEPLAGGLHQVQHQAKHARAVHEEVQVRAHRLHPRDEAGHGAGLDLGLKPRGELGDVRHGVRLARGAEARPLHGEVSLVQVARPRDRRQVLRIGFPLSDEHADLGGEALAQFLKGILQGRQGGVGTHRVRFVARAGSGRRG